MRTARQQGTHGPHALLAPRTPHLRAPHTGDPTMASNSSSCPTPGGGHLNGYPVPPYAFFFPHMLGGLSPPSTLAGIQHQLPVSGYSTPSPASEYHGPAGAAGTPSAGGYVGTPLSLAWHVGANPRLVPGAVALLREGVPAPSHTCEELILGTLCCECQVLFPMCPCECCCWGN